MKIKRNLSLAIGLLASILGLSILVDTAMADGCGCCCCCCCNSCPNTMASTSTMACTSAIICLGQDDINCLNHPNNLMYEVMNDFPRSFADNPDPTANTVCNAPLRNCSRPTGCMIDSDGKCATKPGSNVWASAAKNTTEKC